MDNQQATLESRTLTTEDLAWLGGVIDGEGCISLYRRIRGKAVNFTPEIVISNSDPYFIEECAKILEMAEIGHWVQWRKPGKNRQSKKMMGCVITRGFKRTQRATTILIPYIRAKRDQAKLMLEFVEDRLACKQKCYSYTERDDEIYRELRILKNKEAPETIRGGYRYHSPTGDTDSKI